MMALMIGGCIGMWLWIREMRRANRERVNRLTLYWHVANAEDKARAWQEVHQYLKEHPL